MFYFVLLKRLVLKSDSRVILGMAITLRAKAIREPRIVLN